MPFAGHLKNVFSDNAHVVFYGGYDHKHRLASRCGSVVDWGRRRHGEVCLAVNTTQAKPAVAGRPAGYDGTSILKQHSVGRVLSLDPPLFSGEISAGSGVSREQGSTANWVSGSPSPTGEAEQDPAGAPRAESSSSSSSESSSDSEVDPNLRQQEESSSSSSSSSASDSEGEKVGTGSPAEQSLRCHSNALPLTSTGMPTGGNSGLQESGPVGKVMVCQGKDCQSMGAGRILQDVTRAVGDSPGIEVAPCKCLGLCGQGPTVAFRRKGLKPAKYTSVNSCQVAGLCEQHFGC